MGDHIDKDGQFQSDKYPWCKPGFVPMKLTDPAAQPLLWQYAQSRRAIDAEFAEDLETALKAAGYDPYGFEDLPSYGEHMTKEDFVAGVECGGLMDDDGHGSFATATQQSKLDVHPSDLDEPNFQWPAWATHVVWFNQ